MKCLLLMSDLSYLANSYNCKGNPKDLQQAIEWYRKAAEQGHVAPNTLSRLL